MGGQDLKVDNGWVITPVADGRWQMVLTGSIAVSTVGNGDDADVQYNLHLDWKPPVFTAAGFDSPHQEVLPCFVPGQWAILVTINGITVTTQGFAGNASYEYAVRSWEPIFVPMNDARIRGVANTFDGIKVNVHQRCNGWSYDIVLGFHVTLLGWIDRCSFYPIDNW